MKVRYLFVCAALAALAQAASASWMGNLVIPRDQPTDLQPYVYNVYYDTPITSYGSVDGIAIYQMDLSGLSISPSFTVSLLHYTGIGQIYTQYYTSPVFGIYGPTNGVQTYWFGQSVEVQPGDLFVTYGQGIPFSDDPTSHDQFYFTGYDFAPNGTGLIDLSNVPYTGNRVYSAAIHFNPAQGAAVVVPEPASLGLFAGGAAVLMLRRKSRRR